MMCKDKGRAIFGKEESLVKAFFFSFFSNEARKAPVLDRLAGRWSRGNIQGGERGKEKIKRGKNGMSEGRI